MIAYTYFCFVAYKNRIVGVAILAVDISAAKDFLANIFLAIIAFMIEKITT